MRSTAAFLAALALALLAGCADYNATNQSFEPGIVNSTDDFRFQAAAVKDMSQSLEYSWQNTGTKANVTQSSYIAAGSGSLTILDAESTEVYSGNMATNGTVQTPSGTTGAWTIRMNLVDVDGTLNFHVQRGG